MKQIGRLEKKKKSKEDTMILQQLEVISNLKSLLSAKKVGYDRDKAAEKAKESAG